MVELNQEEIKMSRKEDDILNYKKIERKPHQKITIREKIIVSPDRSEKLVKRSNKTMGRDRETEAIHKISDGRPMPVTSCETETVDVSSDESNHSVKIEDTSSEMTFYNDKTSAAMTSLNLYPQGEEPQEEPLDLRNKTLLKKLKRPKEFSMLETYDSAERRLNKSFTISSDSDKSLRAVQTATNTFGASKLKFTYEARSKTNPYPVTIPHIMNIRGIGLVKGLFVPGNPTRICKTDHGLEISLTDPSEGREQDQAFLYSAESKQPTSIDYEGYQHLAISSAVRPYSFIPPNPDGSHLYMPSASFSSGQAIIPATSSDYYWRDTPSTPDITQLSADKKTFAESSESLSPDCHQPDRTDMDVQISKCTEPLSVVNSEQHSSISQSEQESQLPVVMDTGNSTCLPNIPCLHENVKEWTQTEHEALKKRLNKKIRCRTEAPD